MLQQPVAGGMAEGVVDLLEAVEVDVQDGDLYIRVGLLLAETVEILGEMAAVRQAGQLIMHRGMADVTVGFLELRVACLGKALGLPQFVLQAGFLGHVPVEADDDAAE